MSDDPTLPPGPSSDDAARMQRASEIFLDLQDLGPAHREEELKRRCGGDAALKDLVLLLLKGDQLPLPAESLAEDIRLAHDSAPTVVGGPFPDQGSRIGPYRLLQRIGEGGFGSVYLAEQEQPIRRRVALKILKLGMDTRQVVARFEAERQALALMDHPNIAKVFDAGATPTGRPFFVMELVNGLPINEHCDQAKMSLHQRLELIVQVCDGLQHAHQRGVIHRDIKPSNVLVTVIDDKPVPKIIDFGIAKATSARLTEKTIFTEFRQMVGTPEYMSPEQAGQSNQDVDTRTDVYSTGVLLYELLVGATPFDSKRLRSAAYGEMQRIIREEDPPKPSTRLSRQPETLGAVASRRSTPAEKLPRVVRGELDWIVMKTLEKDRARRYDSAGAMGRDIQRYLRGEAIQAAPPSTAYRAKKFVQRNKGVVIAASLLTAALVAGLVGTSLGFFNAEAQRKVAVKESIRAGQEKERADENAAQARAAEAIATRQAYSASMMSASTAVIGVQYATARAFLDAAPQRLRGWEWRVLDAKLDTSIRTCSIAAKPRSGQGTNLILHPDGRSFFTIDYLGDVVAQRWDLASGRLLQSFPPPDPSKELRHNRAQLSPDGHRLTTIPNYRAAGSRSFMLENWDLTTGERSAHVEVAGPDGSDVRTFVSQDGSRVFVYGGERVRSARFASEGVANGAGSAIPKVLADQPLGHQTYPRAINRADTVIVESIETSPYGLVLRDTETLAPTTVLAWSTMVQNVCFSNDDRWLGVTGNDDEARVYDLAANPPTYIALEHPYQANNIRFSPDASLVATIALDHAIRIWDRATGRLLSTYPSETLDPWALMFMPDGKTVAGWESGGTVRFWDVTAESATVLRGHKSIVSRAKFAKGNPAGIIVSSSWEGADGSTAIVRFWDAESGEEVGIYHGQLGDIVFGMDVSDDGRLAAIAIRNTRVLAATPGGEPTGRTDIIDLATGQRVATSPSRRTPSRVTFGRDAQSVILSEYDNHSALADQLHVLDARSGAVLRTRDLDPKSHWVSVRSPDGKTIAALPTSRGAAVASNADRPGTMLILDARTLETVREIDGIPVEQMSLAFSPDGTHIATGGADGTVRLFAIDTGKLLASTSDQGMEVLSLSFSPDGARLASAGVDRMVRIWDAATLDPLAAFAGHAGHIGCVDWDADGHRLVSCSGDFTVRVWEPDPIRTRIQAREARNTALAQVEPMVAKMFEELKDAAKVADRINSHESLTAVQRKTALQVVLKKGLEQHAAESARH
ncbi:MAG: protein kinase [Planctomycetes bacterium]|nr:protein kinase [Planctomycetota bacterium]